jgi:hypothetical protein
LLRRAAGATPMPCSVNCPMVVAARYGYSVPPSKACICAKQNRSIWVRLSRLCSAHRTEPFAPSWSSPPT